MTAPSAPRPTAGHAPATLAPVERRTFPKNERLCGRERVSAVATKGRSVHMAPFRLIGLPMELDAPHPVQVAFAVPRRNLKRAVDRNRTKRLMREAYRLQRAPYLERLAPGEQAGWLFVFQGKSVPSWNEVREKIRGCMDRWTSEDAA